MPSINGIVFEPTSRGHSRSQNLNGLLEWESVIRWNLTCWHNNLKGTGVAE
jgi:hypothetical protein